MTLEAYLKRRRQEIEATLDELLPAPSHPDPVVEAMRYSLFSGGKRLRPILALAAAEAVSGDPEAIRPWAAAIEMIHTYSLIHDDLPAMDDDDLRRGRPTSHKVHGEALAILAGDALLTEAFRVMGDAALASGAAARRGLRVLTEVAQAAGARGMVAGQAADMAAEGTDLELPAVDFIHVRKTGELIRASVRAGAILAGARETSLRRLTRYAEFVGLAFQIADDVLDLEGGPEVTGKNAGRDAERHKATYPGVIGVPAARRRARELLDAALAELEPLARPAEPLRQIARHIVDRACPPPS